jgi:hypothetical protein
VWPAFELVPCEPQPIKGVEVPEVEATASIHGGLSEPGCPDQRVNNERKHSWLRDAIQVACPVKIDQGFGPVQVLWDCLTHGIDCTASEFEPAA